MQHRKRSAFLNHNGAASTQDLNLARVGLSKSLNSLARWAPEIANPVDVNGKDMVYTFGIRDYWGCSQVDTSSNFKLCYGGSDGDLSLSQSGKISTSGDPVSFNDSAKMRNTLRDSLVKDKNTLV